MSERDEPPDKDRVFSSLTILETSWNLGVADIVQRQDTQTCVFVADGGDCERRWK